VKAKLGISAYNRLIATSYRGIADQLLEKRIVSTIFVAQQIKSDSIYFFSSNLQLILLALAKFEVGRSLHR
jgi:hypothetical protein